MDGDIHCAVHGPLTGLQTLRQVFRGKAEAAGDDSEDDAES